VKERITNGRGWVRSDEEASIGVHSHVTRRCQEYDLRYSRSSRSLDTDTVVRHLSKEETCEEVDGFGCGRERSLCLYSCWGVGRESVEGFPLAERLLLAGLVTKRASRF
jgi:hypothetical protein